MLFSETSWLLYAKCQQQIIQVLPVLRKNKSEHLIEQFKQAPSPTLAQDVIALGGENAKRLLYVLDELGKELWMSGDYWYRSTK